MLFLLHAAVTTMKMTVDVIVSALWRLNVYDTVMARLLVDVTEVKSFCCSTMQNYLKLSTKVPCIYFSALCNNIFLQIWIFLATSFEKNIGTIWTVETFARGSE